MDSSIMPISLPQPFSLSLILHPSFILSKRQLNSLYRSQSAAARRRPRTLTVSALPSSSRNNQKNPNSFSQTSHTFLFSSLSALASLSLLIPSSSFSTPLYTTPSSTDAAATATTTQTERRNASEMIVLQATLKEAWNVVHRSFFDRTYNNQGSHWDATLHKALEEISNINSKDEAYMKIKNMISTLGDPYTRIVDSKVVQSPIEGGPAARAGIVHGDELFQINGEEISDMKDEEVFNLLQGQAGTPVTLKVRHHQSGGNFDTELAEVTLVREEVFFSPVSSAIIPHLLQDGHSSKTGYIHISSFSQNAAHDLESTILQMEQRGVDFYILDLRGNPGGLVEAGLDAAQLWLNGYKTIINMIDHEGKILPLTVRNTRALTNDPLVVLVDKGTGSASEILAAALHDNRRATLIGEKTFGKGKIQSVTELQDGSRIFVTIAKYLSPNLHPIDDVGITPDTMCTQDPKKLTSKVKGVMSLKNMDQDDVEALAHDSCVFLAESQLGM